MKRRGEGRLFKRKNGSRFWWGSLYVRGREVRFSTKIEHLEDTDASEDKKLKAERAAWNVLRHESDKRGADRIGSKTYVTPAKLNTKVDELLDDLVIDYQNKHKNTPQFRSHLAPIRSYFAKCQIGDIDEKKIKRYISERQQAGKKDATINRETGLLQQAFRQAKIPNIPEFMRLEEHNTRHGEFSASEFNRLVQILPDYLQDFARWAYFTGWRIGAIRSLRWQEVNYDTLLCREQYSKNREAHRIPLVGPLRDIVGRRRAEEKGEFVFHYGDGEPIGDIRKSWHSALKLAACEGKIFHDFRRTAATNLIRAGVPEKVAMRITGHKTRSMFDRYNIVADRDVRQALEQRQEFEKELLAVEPTALLPVAERVQ